MDAADLLWTSAAIHAAIARDDAGTVIRLARRAADLNQTALGRLCGYSASTISRIERGQPPVHDIAVRRRIANTLVIPPQYLGLAPATEPTTPTPRVVHPPRPGPAVKVERTPAVEGDTPVRRRELLTGLTAAAVSTWPWPAAESSSAAADADVALDDLLTAASVHAKPAPTAELTRALTAAQTAFTKCRYNDLAVRLPQLIAVTTASQNTATGTQRENIAATLAAAYQLASELCIKLNDDALGWVLADRAMTVARASGRADTIASSTRSVAIAMRRTGHQDAAIGLLTSAAHGLDLHHRPPDGVLAPYGSLLCTAAYSSAQRGNHAQAVDLIDEAAEAAGRLTTPHLSAGVAFSSTNVTIYKIAIFTVLGDSATALRHASSVQPGVLPTPERHSRFCIDTARAWERHGRPDRAHQALRAAERHAPEELRRPSVRDLISGLLYGPTPAPPGLRELAVRVGAVC
jgi:transcriptional regulator with XRE-family HTH domain